MSEWNTGVAPQPVYGAIRPALKPQEEPEPVRPQTVMVLSLFRNSERAGLIRVGGVGKYWETISQLTYPKELLSFCWLEGDSVDNTYSQLANLAHSHSNIYLHQFQTGRPQYPSVVDAGRMHHLSNLGRKTVELIRQSPSTDYVLFMESDLLISDPDMIQKLMAVGADVAAPMVVYDVGGAFYDTWGFVDIHGMTFHPMHPYHPDVEKKAPIPMSSVGSCFLAKREVYERCDYVGEDAFRSFFSDVNRHGYRVVACPDVHIIHPRNHHLHQFRGI